MLGLRDREGIPMITDKEVEAARRVLLDNAGMITRKTVRAALEAAQAARGDGGRSENYPIRSVGKHLDLVCATASDD